MTPAARAALAARLRASCDEDVCPTARDRIAAAAELERADKMRAVLLALATGCDDEYAGECDALDHVFGHFNAERDPLAKLKDCDDLAAAIRDLVGGAA